MEEGGGVERALAKLVGGPSRMVAGCLVRELAGESLVFNPAVSNRGLQRLGGGARREGLGRGKEPYSDARGSFPDLFRDFFRVSGL